MLSTKDRKELKDAKLYLRTLPNINKLMKRGYLKKSTPNKYIEGLKPEIAKVALNKYGGVYENMKSILSFKDKHPEEYQSLINNYKDKDEVLKSIEILTSDGCMEALKEIHSYSFFARGFNNYACRSNKVIINIMKKAIKSDTQDNSVEYLLKGLTTLSKLTDDEIIAIEDFSNVLNEHEYSFYNKNNPLNRITDELLTNRVEVKKPSKNKDSVISIDLVTGKLVSQIPIKEHKQKI